MGKPKSNTAEFITKSNNKHHHFYDYEQVNYITQHIPVVIKCPIHGFFTQKPKAHLRYGCNKCAQELRLKSIRKTSEEILSQCFLVHQDRYDYSKMQFLSTRQKVEIICKIHGSFWQTMHDHLSGKGCAKCINKVSKNETRWLDVMGIDPKFRNYNIKLSKSYYVDGYDPMTKTIYEFNGDYWHGNPSKFCPDKINNHTKCSFGQLYQQTLAKEVEFKKHGYKVISIWEADFVNIYGR
jgi:hypothetical protein